MATPTETPLAVLERLKGKILFKTERSGLGTEIWVMDPDGSKKRRVAEDCFCLPLSWTPDGQRIAYQRKDGIYLATPDGVVETRRTSDLLPEPFGPEQLEEGRAEPAGSRASTGEPVDGPT